MGLLSFRARISLLISLLLSGLQVASFLKIHPKPCTNALGVRGTCMFVWDCIKIDGNHLGTCVDGFLFGSCCDQSVIKDANDTTVATTSSSTLTTHTSVGEGKKPAEIQPTELVMAPPISITSVPLIVSQSTFHSRQPMTKPTTSSQSMSLKTPNKSTVSVISSTSTTAPSTGSVSHSSPTTPNIAAATRSPEARNEECGVPAAHAQSKVVGGTNAEFGTWPWQASVRRTSFFGFSSTHRCGGAIISRQWVATAGHCVDDLLLAQIRIRVGEYDFASILEPYPYVERGVKKKVVHPRYNFFTYENDLALVQLEEPLEPFPHISSICLPPDSADLIGRNSTVTGWGRLSEGGTLPSILQQVQLPIISNEKCKNMFLKAGRQEYIPDIFMCAGFEDGGRDSCQGDSGGPLQVQGDDGKWFLAGIISWGIGCAEANMPGVCTRISKFKDWILQNIT